MEPETNKHQGKKCSYIVQTDYSRKFFEELTCQTYGKNSLGDVSNEFTDIFLVGV